MLLISLATAAAISGVIPASAPRPGPRPVVASSRIHSRNSPTVSARSGAKAVAIVPVEDQPADLVVVRVDQRVIDDLRQRQVGQHELGGDALALGRARPAPAS